MKKLSLAALLAALLLAGVSMALAQTPTDLFIGFNDAAGPVSAQNDYVIDIGSFSALTNSASTNGGTIDLMSANAPLPIDQPTFTSTFATAFSSDSGELNDVAAGVAGGQTTTSPKQLWQTMPTGVTPPLGGYPGNPNTISGSALSIAAAQPQALIAGNYASSTQNTGWTWLVAASPAAPGTEPSGGLASASKENPMGQLSSGSLVLNLWQDTRANGTSQTTSGWTNIGYFTFNLNTDDITFSLGAAPAPPTIPTIATFSLSGGNFSFSGGNGQANAQYRILSATNMSVPGTNWTPVYTSSFSATGAYSFTNAVSSSPAAYFRLVSP